MDKYVFDGNINLNRTTLLFEGGFSLIRNINKLLKKASVKRPPVSNNQGASTKFQDMLNEDFEQNVNIFRSIYLNCSDVLFRSFLLFGQKKAVIIYIQGLSDIEGLENFVLTPLMQEKPKESPFEILENKLPVSQVEK